MKRATFLVFLLIPMGFGLAEQSTEESWATLEFTELEDGVNATWKAHIVGFETTNTSEELLGILESRDSLSIGCCLIQNSKMEVITSQIENLSISQGIATWDELYQLEIDEDKDLLRLDIPAIDYPPLRVITPTGWQISSSVAPSWMSGVPHDLVIDRTITSLPSMITLVLSKNQPPEFEIDLPVDLPWDIPIELQVNSGDVYLSSINCEWNLSSNPFTISNSQFSPSENISITTTCTDEGGLQNTVVSNHRIDMSYPVVESIAGVNTTCNEDCSIITVPSETPLGLTLNLSDDLTESPKVRWTSNKSADWSADGNEINLSFWPIEGINTASTNISERVKRNPLQYWLLAEISDNSGRVTNLNLSIIVTDASSPNIVAEMLYGSDNRPIAGESFDVDLTQSWDMWDTYQDLEFQFFIDGESVDRPFIADAGEHILRIDARDTSNNLRSKEIMLLVNPAIGLDLHLLDAESDEGKTRIELENHGSSEGWFRICYEQECVMGFTKGATWEGPEKTAVVLETEPGWFENMILSVEWEDEQGTVHRDSIDSGITGEPPIPLSICLPLVFILALVIFLFTKSGNTEEES